MGDGIMALFGAPLAHEDQLRIDPLPPESAGELLRALVGDAGAGSQGPDAERSERYFRQALALAEEIGMRPQAARCHLGLGRLSRRTGKRQEAQEHLQTAVMMYREMDMRFWLEQAEAQMASNRPIVGQTDGP